MTDRPLHPEGIDERVFQHPIKGYVIHYPDYLSCWVNDMGKGPHHNDTRIYVGVEVFRARNELGAWLDECHPHNMLMNHMFVEAVFPCDFEGDDQAVSAALLGRIDMAGDVVQAGGACTICDAPNIDGEVEHAIGCEYLSWILYNIARRVLDENGEPSLGDVVQAANEQIARMT